MDFYSEYEPFSEEAMKRLMERHTEPEHLKEMTMSWHPAKVEKVEGNSVYLCFCTKHPDFYIPAVSSELTWFRFHGHLRTPAAIRLDDDMVWYNKTYPAELRLLVHFGCTVWNSKIYIVGGYLREDAVFIYNDPTYGCNQNFIANHGPSQKVYVYDTHSEEWQTSMMNNGERGHKPIVVAADDKIFVFGGYEAHDLGVGLDEDREKAIQAWSEFNDAAEDTPAWHYLPNRVPYYLIAHPPRTSAVYQRGKQILFWSNTLSHDVYNNVVFSYNYEVKEWRQYDATASICRGPYWSLNKVVVIEDFVFWYHGQTIYAHDLISDTTSPVYQVPELPTLGVLVGDIHLVHLGRAKLALFCCADDKSVWYHTTLARTRRMFGVHRLRLFPVCTGYISVPNATLVHALEVPY